MYQFVMSIFLVLGLSALLLSLGVGLSKKAEFNQAFMSPFECGFSPSSTVKMFFSARFFIMALVFLIFDVELILLFPFLCLGQSLSFFSLLLMIFFINILSIGLYYEWNTSMLNWLY